MSIIALKEQLNRDKLVALRTYPEVGADDGLETLMDVVQSGSKLALILGVDEDSRPVPYRVVPMQMEDVVRVGDTTYISERAAVGMTVWVVRPATKAETERWDAHQDNYDDYDEDAVDTARERLAEVRAAKESAFDVVQWWKLVATKLTPAGAMGIDNGQLVVVSIPEFDDAAINWKTRFTRVPKNGLETISELADRDEAISSPIKVKAPDIVTALEKVRYRMARDHFAQTGKSLFG